MSTSLNILLSGIDFPIKFNIYFNRRKRTLKAGYFLIRVQLFKSGSSDPKVSTLHQQNPDRQVALSFSAFFCFICQVLKVQSFGHFFKNVLRRSRLHFHTRGTLNGFRRFKEALRLSAPPQGRRSPGILLTRRPPPHRSIGFF